MSTATDVDQAVETVTTRTVRRLSWHRLSRRQAVHITVDVVLGILVVALLALLWPVQHGGSLGITVVSGHSMEPELHSADVVLTWRQSSYAPGEIVVYPVPGGPGSGIQVVHRVVGVQPDGSLITKGDNNAGPDPWHPAQDTVLGSQIALVPAAGTVLNLVRGRWAISLLIGLAAATGTFWLVLGLTSSDETEISAELTATSPSELDGALPSTAQGKPELDTELNERAEELEHPSATVTPGMLSLLATLEPLSILDELERAEDAEAGEDADDGRRTAS